MRGDRTNYGRYADSDKITLRLYGFQRLFIKEFAEREGISKADAIQRLITHYITKFPPKETSACADAAGKAEENMDLFRRALIQKAIKRQEKALLATKRLLEVEHAKGTHNK